MLITKADIIQLRIPFEDGGKGEGLFHSRWNTLDFVLLRLETDSGLVGWGEPFSYFCADAVAALMRSAVVPLLIGQDPANRDTILADMRQKLHIIGRYGITQFCISGADIALWDLAAKTEGVPLSTLLGGARRTDVPAYASLVRYGDSDLVSEIAAKAVAEGYGTIKLHEIELPYILAGRAAIGPDIALTNDVNCNWSVQQTLDWAPDLRSANLLWLEEPIFPPEDFATLARLRQETGLAIATGENACTAFQFGQMIDAGAADFIQPSVTKIGGIAETLATREMAYRAGVTVAQHAPYFGPGYLASLHLLAAAPDEELFEVLYIDRAADLYRDMPLANDGRIAIPDGAGMGMDPDPAILERYAV